MDQSLLINVQLKKKRHHWTPDSIQPKCTDSGTHIQAHTYRHIHKKTQRHAQDQNWSNEKPLLKGQVVSPTGQY